MNRSKHSRNEIRLRQLVPRIGILFLLAAVTGLICWQYSKRDGSSLSHPRVTDSRTEKQAQVDFDKLMLQIFREEVSDDSITLNYRLEDPSVYNIDETELTLGHCSIEDMQESLAVSENRIAAIETYDYDKLREDQQLTYDIIYTMLQQNMESADLLEYAEYLGPTTGIQAQLPVLLVEYHFWDKEAVENYISLLGKVPDYFKEILEFEKQKSKDGLFMSDRTVQAILDQCEDFIKEPEKNYMITSFADRLKSLKLSESEQKKYIEANKKAVLESVVPAYQTLIDGLRELKGTGENKNGLCGLPKGKEYYEYLVRAKTGSNRSMEEIRTLLEEAVSENKTQMATVMVKNEKAYQEAQNVKYPYDKPEETIQHLQKDISNDFPDLPEGIRCEVKYVDPSLEESMSPAFYLTPALDHYQENVVYLNGSKKYDLSKVFTTIAHESYPGHLYQTCYFQSQNLNPVRGVVSIGGYTEGWGTYAELYSYQLAKLDEDVEALLSANTLLTLALYGKADLEVNYGDWDFEQLKEYLGGFGFSKATSRIIFDAVVQEPASYMQYVLGYLEIEDLKKQAEKELGEDFTLKEFHEFFLSAGPAPFIVLQDRLDQWIQENKK